MQIWTDLDLHCLQRQGISGFNRTRVNLDPFNPLSSVDLNRYFERQCRSRWDGLQLYFGFWLASLYTRMDMSYSETEIPATEIQGWKHLKVTIPDTKWNRHLSSLYTFYTPPHNSGGVFWLQRPCVLPSVRQTSVRPPVFRFRMITWVNINGFSPNLVCVLILWRSGLGLLMGKFSQRTFDGIFCPRYAHIFVSGR